MSPEAQTEIDIRDIESIAEMRAVEELQREVWGFEDREILPLTMMRASREVGAILVGAFDGAVRDWAAKLASKSPILMRLGHDAMYRQQDMELDDALEFLRSQLSLTFTTEDMVEGVQAFFEKREPQWKGR